MNLLWPWYILLLVLLPVAVAFYLWILRRRRRYAVRYSSLSIIRSALPTWSRWRRHLPFALFLVGLASLTTALARPAAKVTVPLSQTTIVLALDVSRSMCATDVEPNRLSVAQEAALAFIDEQAAATKIGIVAFAGFAEIVVPPTNDMETLKKSVENLTTSLGTAMGSATLKSIDAISEINPAVEPSALNLRRPEENFGNIAAGYQPDIIVLLTDGANTHGPLPSDAAQQAADRGLRVYTIGFGSTEFSEMVCSRQQLGSDAFSEGGFGGGFGGGFSGSFGSGFRGDFRRFLLLDEPTLREVADITGGAYYRAENADQLFEVFKELPTEISLQKQFLEISVLFVALGVLVITAAMALSLRWNRL